VTSGVTDRVRDAMVIDPRVLDVSDTAQAAGQALVRPKVRALFVCEGERLVGVITRKTLIREVVAAGRDPRTTPLGEIVEEPNATIEPDVPLDDAFRFLEENDLERVPVVEDGRLVGVLSRSGIQRRLAEDKPPDEPDES
jgi:CBS domain-containing protein